ncbi:hypothetical protein EYR40_006624 [Pleurotus pulmonarius]|nr:hypothetical protein EYR36_011245 [Pleurotus pulmonarius]KAF4599530.1 hypothetical protein EYR40_006624 [Pleurotus pulmonarius]
MDAIPYVLQSDRPQAYQAMDAVHLRGIPPQGDRVHPASHIPPALPAKDLIASDPRPVSQASTVVANHRLLPPLVIANGCPSLSTSSGTTSSDTSHLRPRSPSIANLDSLSVVKQRLAQIQSPTKDTGMPPLTAFSRLPSPQKLKLPKQDEVTPLSAYDANNTILDYYRGNGNDDDRYASTVVPVTPQDILGQQDYGPIVNLDISQRHDAIDTAGQIYGLPPYSRQTTDVVSGPQPRSSANNADSSSHLLETINAKLEALVNQPSEKDAQSSKLLPSIRELARQLDSSRREQAAKLDTILSATTMSAVPPAHDSSAILNKLDKLIETQRNSAARSDDPEKHAQLEQLIHQQADSVRYLNELNSWLEAFVSNGTTQIQGLAANVEALCQSMGCSTSDARGLPYDGLREDIHRFILETRARDENVATIHHNMMALLNEQRQGGVNAPHDLIAGIMHQQRQDHEAMLSALVHEVSSEIRGERLRFVEAMKEATQINVQMHVDQFKRELNKEVVTMTKEVQRLHNEKKAMENQIAELFSFYSKRAPAEIDPGRLHFSR